MRGRIVTLGLLAAFLSATGAEAQNASLGSVPCLSGYCPVLPVANMPGYPVDTTRRVVTKTNVTANTSTPVCPAPTVINGNVKLISQQVQSASGGGLGLQGQTLTGAVLATGSGAPDLVLGALQYYNWPNVPMNTTTFYGAAQAVVCIQDFRP